MVGIDQFSVDISERLDLTEPTSIHLGLTFFRTSLSAYQVLWIGAFGVVLLVALVVTKVRSGQTA